MTLAEHIARWRVTLGFILAAVVLYAAQPTATTLTIGGGVALIGELIRIWAAGHVEKSREVTRSGPYLGSSIIGVGVAIASGSVLVAAIVIAYLAATITAAIRAEEAHLREKFGGEYDAYASRLAPPMIRSFSVTRALANREHHTVAGLIAAFALLALKVGYWIR